MSKCREEDFVYNTKITLEFTSVPHYNAVKKERAALFSHQKAVAAPKRNFKTFFLLEKCGRCTPINSRAVENSD
jgi:NADH:ubiquinone oxidoreductase subunit F (NADH-binding)